MNRLNILSLKNILFSMFSIGLFLLSGTTTFAAYTPTDLDGYAWSSNIGWISLNCKTGGNNGADICGTSTYKVKLTSTGTLTGYAWSSNIGWIKFDGLSGYPNTTYGSVAKVTGTSPNLTFEGWARACAATIKSGDSITAPTQKGNCSTMTSRPDGWDGWISLKGANYGVTTNASGFVSGSYVWGDEVVGWIDMFTQVRFLMPTANIDGNNCLVAKNQSTCATSVTWTITNATNPIIKDSNNVTISNQLIGNKSVTLTLDTPIVFTALDGANILDSVQLEAIGCVGNLIVGPGGTCVDDAPVISIRTDKTLIRSGSTVNITWTINPSPVSSGNCKVTGPGTTINNITSSGNTVSNALTSKSLFKISCTGPYGTIESTTKVDVVAKMPEV